MKRVITTLIFICVFLTSCAKNNVDIPIEEMPDKTENITSEIPPSISSNTATQEITNHTTNEMAVEDNIWIDIYSGILNGDNLILTFTITI